MWDKNKIVFSKRRFDFVQDTRSYSAKCQGSFYSRNITASQNPKDKCSLLKRNGSHQTEMVIFKH